VKQYQGEPLKDFLNRFGALVVKLHTKDEALMVHAFGHDILSRPFNDSLIRNWAKTFSEIRQRAIAHIDTEEQVTVERGSVGPTKPQERSRAQPMRVHEAAMEKRFDGNCPATHNPIIRRMKTYRLFIDLIANMGLIGLLFIFVGPIKRTTLGKTYPRSLQVIKT